MARYALYLGPLLLSACARFGYDLLELSVSDVQGGTGGRGNAEPTMMDPSAPPMDGSTGVIKSGGTVDGGTTSRSPLDTGTANDADTELPLGWPYRKTIVVLAAEGNQALIDFPLLVSVNADAQLAAGVALEGGADIQFTLSDNTTQLDHEIESYNSETGQLVAWVRMPSLLASATTTIHLNYGNPQAPEQQNASGVWNTG